LITYFPTLQFISQVLLLKETFGRVNTRIFGTGLGLPVWEVGNLGILGALFFNDRALILTWAIGVERLCAPYYHRGLR